MNDLYIKNNSIKKDLITIQKIINSKNSLN